MTEQIYFKLREILREKYVRSFASHLDFYQTDKNKDLETQWHLYLHSIGCQISTEYSKNTIECPDSHHRVYPTRYIAIPDKLVFKMLTLGSLP